MLAFLARSIDSVETLEVLLQLRTAPAAGLSVEQLTAALVSSDNSIATRIRHLVGSRLIETTAEPGHYRLSRRGDSGAIIDEIASLYPKFRVKVIAAIYESSDDDPLQSFSDAFRLRRER